ncbi:MAG: Gfo/Idh/MocA family oxidoreductase [Planctomycetota bacterium]
MYHDYARILADPELDIIDICTPHPFHPEQAIKGAQAGKHLIIEKPIAWCLRRIFRHKKKYR